MHYLYLLIFLIANQSIAFSDNLFDRTRFIDVQYQRTDATALDFNGDGFDDLYLYNKKTPKGNCTFRLNEAWPITGERYYAFRSGINAWLDIGAGFIHHTIPRSTQSNDQEGLLLLYQNMLYIYRYRNYEEDNIRDFDRFDYQLDLGEFTQIQDAAIGDYLGDPILLDLAVVAGNGVENRLFLFESPFEMYYSSPPLNHEIYQDARSPDCAFPFPNLESGIFSLQLDSMERDELFFQSGGRWNVWSFGEELNSESDIEKYDAAIPPGAARLVDVVETGFKEYPIMVAVESDKDSDVAYAAYRNLDGEGLNLDFQNPIAVSIPNKSAVNTVSRLFSYRKRGEANGFPLLVIADNSFGEEASDRNFYFYRIDESNSLDPELTQTVTLHESEYIFTELALEPMSLFQFNADGIPDLLITNWWWYYALPGSNPTSAVSESAWLRFK